MEDMIPVSEWVSDNVPREPREEVSTFQAFLRLLRRSCVKPSPFIITRPVDIENLNRVFEPAIYPINPQSQQMNPLGGES